MVSSGSEAFILPVVDFSAFHDVAIKSSETSTSSTPTKETMMMMTQAHHDVATALDEACRNHGFVCLRNSGLSTTLVQRMFIHSQNLFQCTEEEKSKLMPLDPIENTGYNGFQKEALNRLRRPDLKESFNVRNPSCEGYLGFQGTSNEFQDVATEFWNQITNLGHAFAICCALALGLELNYFSKTLKELDLTTVRMLHYPPIATSESSSSSSSSPSAVDDMDNLANESIRVGEHTDFGLFTFLLVHNIADVSSQGLQVKPIEGADLGMGSLVERESTMFTSGWKDVVLPDELLQEIEVDPSSTVLVNTGALMARWTNDTWRATAHRVIVPPEARPYHRYSIAGFFDPDKKTICTVNPKFVKEGEEPKYPPISSMDYLYMKLREMTEVPDQK